jgi:secreted trypsin-like serine protease
MTFRPRALVVLALALALLVPASAATAQDARPGGEPEIIGGGAASPGEYPFMVGLLRRNTADRYQAQFCGGSLIADDLVLTAAHCVADGPPANRLDLLIGTNRLATPGGERIHASAIHIHPGYNPQTSGNDIAVVELAEPSTLGETIPNIQAGQFDLWDPGTVATVIGWGDRDRRDATVNFPVRLYEVTVPIVSNPQCRNAYGAAFIATKMVCAGDLANGGRDSCQGDSGGPLFVPDGGSGWVQVGIVSFGIGCGIRRFPGVYTRLARYEAFVEQFLA